MQSDLLPQVQDRYIATEWAQRCLLLQLWSQTEAFQAEKSSLERNWRLSYELFLLFLLGFFWDWRVRFCYLAETFVEFNERKILQTHLSERRAERSGRGSKTVEGSPDRWTTEAFYSEDHFERFEQERGYREVSEKERSRIRFEEYRRLTHLHCSVQRERTS